MLFEEKHFSRYIYQVTKFHYLIDFKAEKKRKRKEKRKVDQTIKYWVIEILGNMCTAIIILLVCDVINFETNFSFLIKSFSYMTKTSR